MISDMKNLPLSKASEVPGKASTAASKDLSTNSQLNLEPDTLSEQTTIDIDGLQTNHDLATLKKEDPFLYFSIPAVRKAEYLIQDVDISRLDTAAIRRNCISCPGRMEMQEFSQASRTVYRKSRISFECHDSLIMSSIYDEILNDKNGKAQYIDDGIDLLSLLEDDM
mmetsp:Transcript_3899/g.8280  ORF Transcript_3899/g.8280 Transcript_3899/m.8280 type:complete len:167 (-) Transcript_3899:96-596(-)